MERRHACLQWFIMSVALRARCVLNATPSYSARVGKWSHEKSKAKKTCRFSLLFDCKKGAFKVGAVRHRFFARRLHGAVGAVGASCGSQKLLQKRPPQVDGVTVFASGRGSGVLGARAVRRLLWWVRLRVH